MGAVGVYWNFFAEQSITISQSELQSRVDAKIPFAAKHDVMVSKATVTLGNDITLDFVASTKKSGKEYSLNGVGKGVLTYDNGRGDFYFKPEKLELKDFKANGAAISEIAASTGTVGWQTEITWTSAPSSRMNS